jgi:hypothetical protein
MSDYGVGGEKWEPLPWEWAAARLTPTRNYWVVTVSPRGQPHAMPVWGVWDDTELRYSFGCAPNSRKARNLAANPRLTFTNDDTVECVSVQGTAALLDHGARIDWWADRYVAKYGDEVGPEFGDFVRSHPMYEVTPTVAFGMIERAEEFAERATRWRFP